MTKKYTYEEGMPSPLGANCVADGVNFALFSANAEKVQLCLYDDLGQVELQRIPLLGYQDQVWHVYVKGLKAGAVYGYRVYGPYDPHVGHRFNPHKLLLDPYARKIEGVFRWADHHHAYEVGHPSQDLLMDTRDNGKDMPKSVVVDLENNPQLPKSKPVRPAIPWNDTIIYETHVKGFTQLNLAVPARERGTLKGLSHPEVLAYIKGLGVTAIELLPVHGFIDEHFLATQDLSNYWGYNSLHFFAPHQGYLNNGDPFEFRRLADAVHDAGLELILDVVYNHTCEGNHLGPTLSFRGIDNASYYCLQSQDARFYTNDTGCGNTLNLKHPRVLQMVMDSLRYWVEIMGVDGFRFDQATVLGRETYGFDPGSGFFDAIRQDPTLANIKMIAEPWDIGPGGYQLGNYPAGWSEWNDRYRDTCRRFWKGDPGVLPEFARRIHGSSDLFEHSGRSPSSSINFVTSHDGFTLHDLVSYQHRHNEANNEQNRDGHHANFSDNFGIEGETDDPRVNELRARQKRNFLASLFLSQGTPMLLAGDELGRTQKGNNNTYCQDNELNWIDWSNISQDGKSLQKFVANLCRVRMSYPMLRSTRYIHTPEENNDGLLRCVRWISAQGEEMLPRHWNEQYVQTLGWILEQQVYEGDEIIAGEQLLIMFNASLEDISFILPKSPNVTKWQRVLDTCEPEGLCPRTPLEPGSVVLMPAKSMRMKRAHFKPKKQLSH